MKYTHSAHDFSVDILPISPGELERLLRMTKASVGVLREFLCDLLFDIPGVQASKFWFTLVNVTCTHTGFSYGLAEPPPEKVRPLAATYLFTFDLRGAGYIEDSVPSKIVRRGLDTVLWGNKSVQFVTIGVTHRQTLDWVLGYNRFAPQVLYYLLGTLTKNFILNRRFASDTNYESMYSTWNLTTLRAKWLMTPLYSLLRYAEYPRLVFNRTVWSFANNLLSPKHITTESLLYMCRHVKQVSKLPKQLEDLVVGKFQDSFADYIHRCDSKQLAEEPWQELYPALVKRGEIADPNDFTLPTTTGNHKSHILSLLYD